DLFAVNLWRPLEFHHHGGGYIAFFTSLGRLGLTHDHAARASEALHAGPLADQLGLHLRMLFGNAGAIAQSPAAPMIGEATANLVRAALVAAVDEEPFRRDDGDQDLTAVVRSYIGQHLTDPDLSAERIAQAMFISVRQVYKVWEGE